MPDFLRVRRPGVPAESGPPVRFPRSTHADLHTYGRASIPTSCVFAARGGLREAQDVGGSAARSSFLERARTPRLCLWAGTLRGHDTHKGEKWENQTNSRSAPSAIIRNLRRSLSSKSRKATAPWQKPWKAGERIGPRNLASDRPYSGSNTLRLMAVAADRGYSDSRWATYGQVQVAGDQIRKGERGTPILSFKTHRRVAVRDEKGQPVKDKNGEQVYRHEKLSRPFTRIYTVFNVEQARNIKAEPRPEPGKAWEAHKRAEDVIKASGVPVKHVQGDRAYYSLGSDQVVLPEKSQFPSRRPLLPDGAARAGPRQRPSRPPQPRHPPAGRPGRLRLRGLRPRGTAG